MAVPTSISELSTTPGVNPPSGSDSPTVTDDHFRAAYSFIKTLSDDKADSADAVLLTGDQTIAGIKTFSSAPVVPNDSFALAKLQNIATARILGRSTASSGDIEELTLGANLTLVAGVLNAVDGVPAGSVSAFAMNTAPTGWLKANGAAVNRTTYATLFTAIGTTFGTGDGSTTFNLPDLRGEFIRGWDDSRGVDSGRVFGSSQAAAFAAHKHLQNEVANTVSGQDRYGQTNSGINTRGRYAFEDVTSATASNTSTEGGTETRPRNVALLACIKF